jgi:hypothetical protein
MLRNKIVPDQTRVGNENRAHVGRAGIYNEPTPMTSTGGVAGPVSPGEMPGGLLNGNSVPMTLDPHSGQRRSNNLANPAGEVSRSARTAETRRRIYSRNTDYKY